MKSKRRTLIGFLFLGSGLLILALAAKESCAAIITVDDDNGADYTRIQDAIDNSTEGDTIRVYEGTYFENVVANMSVSLIGNGSTNTTIDGDGNGDVVHITADRVNMSGFKITGSGNTSNNAGVKIESDNNLILMINLTGNRNGIYLELSVCNILSNNTCSSNNEHGIYLRSSDNNTISNNTCSSNRDSGICIFTSSCNILYNNTCLNNYHGISLENYSDNNTISNNNCTDNDEGFFIHSSDKNTITFNTFLSNYYYGFYLSRSDNNTFYNNTISGSNKGIYLCGASKDNSAHYNHIFNNTGYGISTTFNSGYSINATNNWWGDHSGPYHPTGNPTGEGDNITDRVEFDPWIGKDEFLIKYVDDDAPDGGNGTKEHPFNRIQEAIDNATGGCTIYVWEGIYYECVVVNKSVSLIGNGSENTTIDGGGKGDVVRITADWTNMSGFRVTGSGNPGDGISVESHRNRIFGINCSDHSNHGIYLDSSNNNTLSNNICNANNEHGIYLSSSNNNTLFNNTCLSNMDHGVYIKRSLHNTVLNNTCNANHWHGIFIEFSDNITLTNNSCSSNKYYGIYLRKSCHNRIHSNTCNSNNENGIHISNSENNTIFTNNCSKNNIGIYLSSSCYNNLSGNEMEEDGISIWGISLECWNTHYIDSTNLVNGKPVYYYRNSTRITVPHGAGEVILANCSRVTVDHQNLSNGSVGILVGYSNNVTLVNNTCEYNQELGIFLEHSGDITISNNTCCSNNLSGIYLRESDHNILYHNTCNSNQLFGIDLYSSDYNGLDKNICNQNKDHGVHLRGNNNILCDNICSSNDYAGIIVYGDRNSFYNATCSSNGFEGITIYGDHNTLFNNTCSINNYGIYVRDSSNTILTNNTCCSNYNYGICLRDSSNTILTNNTCCSNYNYGIFLRDSSNSTICNSTISGNKIGIKLYRDSSENTARYNNILDNVDYGILVDTDKGHSINATCNWWGAPSGPYHSTLNPEGKGDKVTDHVEFKPWLYRKVTHGKSLTWYVDDDAPDGGSGSKEHPFNRIQDAINLTEDGDTIRVYAGIYYENIFISKSVSLIGNGPENTTIDGEGSGNVVTISANWVNMSGFRVTGSGSGYYNTGIKIESDHNLIFKNNCSNNYHHGISVQGSDNILSDNICYNNRYGITIASINNTLMNNTCAINRYYGISAGGSNNTLSNNTCSNNEYGISVPGHDNILSNNTCSYNDHGIYLWFNSNYNTLTNNTCDLNNNYGITLSNSENNILKSNRMVGNGIFISGDIDEWNSHTIDNTNTVNGKPVHCYKNASGLTLHPGAGQIILVNCSWMLVENQNCSDASVGILIGYSSYITIRNNTCCWNRDSGISLWNSHYNTLLDNTCLFNQQHGIHLSCSAYYYLSNNSCSNNKDGIYLASSSNVNITCNNCSYNGIGIELDDSPHNTLINNTCPNNFDGIYLHYSNSNTITKNFCSNNDCGIRIEESHYNTLNNNTCALNDNNGIYLYHSSYDILTNNTCTLNIHCGIYLFASHNTLSKNNCSRNQKTGISLVSNNDNTLTDNTCSHNNEHGIHIRGFHHTIVNNICSHNNEHGIYLFYTTNNIFENNTCSNNTYGIRLNNSAPNTFIYNTVSNNTVGIHFEGYLRKNSAHNNNISNNVKYGISVSDNNGKIIDATYNWWGDNSGPYHPVYNPNGKGNKVTNFVEFNPWLGIGQEPEEKRKIWYVDDDAPEGGNGSKERPFNSIQDAIDDATGGCTIRVFEGRYFENVVVNKPVNLIGNGSFNTTIDGWWLGNVVTITADWVNMSGFRVTGSKNQWGFSGVRIRSNLNHIFDNECFYNNMGVDIQNSHNNILSNNTCCWNQYYGILLNNSDVNAFSNNTLSKNKYGIYLFDSDNNKLYYNIIIGNEVGIQLTSHSGENRAHYNNIYGNADFGINVSSSNGYFINARNNSWGIDSGPYHPTKNPSGQGDNITDYIEFDPWIGKKEVPGKKRTTWYVDDDAPGGGDGSREKPLKRIQDAIDASGDRGIIRVYDGTYHENIIINKIISLIGNGSINTTIDGSGGGDVVQIYSDWVNISCFRITGGGDNDWPSPIFGVGIRIESDHISIMTNNLSNNHWGISLMDSENNIVANNIFSNNKQGIILDSSGWNLLINNICTSTYTNIILKSSNNNIITDNHCNSSGDGIWLYYSHHNTLLNNTCCSNSDGGIKLWYSHFTTISNNICRKNNVGINLYNSDNNTIGNNTCHSNNYDGTNLFGSSNNRFMNNTCILNNANGIILYESSNITITYNTISGNAVGIRLGSDSRDTTAHYNTISGNTEYGINATENNGYAVDARFNFWGLSTGPYHFMNNTSGEGDSVTDYVEFEPWIDEYGNLSYPQKNDKDTLHPFLVVILWTILALLLIMLAKIFISLFDVRLPWM